MDVTVFTPAGASAISTPTVHLHSAANAPTVTGISPDSGPEAGGTSVTITGTGFTGATAVNFGTTAATERDGRQRHHDHRHQPRGHRHGRRDGTSRPSGTSANSAADQFTYTSRHAPTVTGISPNSGPAAGGTSVTITGTGFTGATAVNFGATAATGVTVVDDTTITATSPAGTGVVDVTVVTPAGTSATSAADQFTYIAPPTVTGISPTSGPEAGGTTVTITGTGFTGATAVNFGTTAATERDGRQRHHDHRHQPRGHRHGGRDGVTPAGTSATSAADQFTYTAARRRSRASARPAVPRPAARR